MREKGKWMYAENFISNGVAGNYTKALAVAKYHYNALSAARQIPEIDTIFLTFEVIYNELFRFSVAKAGSVGTLKGHTLTKDKLFAELTAIQLPQWQQLIGNIHSRLTPEFIDLFPDGLTPYHNETMENKLLLLATLLKKCQDDEALAAVAALIDTFNIKIAKACKVQGGDVATVATNISNQKQAVEAMCDAHFANHGVIISIFYKHPKLIKTFTDTRTLQSKVHKPIYNNTANPNKIKTVAVKKATAETKIIVTADADVMVWVNDKAKNKNHPVGIFIPANTPTEAGFTGLGNPANRVFQIHNLSTVAKALFSVEFL